MNRSRGSVMKLIRVLAPLVFGSLIAMSVYMVVSWKTEGIGFPLDDAWIHQTYARSLAQTGQWDYLPGQRSAGSTSPLWSGLLAIGYLIHLAPFPWTFFLGWLNLVGVGCFGEYLFRRQLSTYSPRFPWVGLFLVTEWHLVWAGASGMETMLYSFCLLCVFYLIFDQKIRWILVGLGIGVCVWIRPDGFTLLGPAMFCLFLKKNKLRLKFKDFLLLIIGLAIPVLFYFTFQYWIGGSWMPNTFYAKQAEYAEVLEMSFVQRFLRLLELPMIGAGVLLLPGFIYGIWKAVRRWNWAYLAASIWWLGYTAMYAMRLPVTYQHGRYLIPAMPVYFILGMIGLVDFLKEKLPENTVGRILGRGWLASAGAVGLTFFITGASAYATDVAIIETEMVQTAQWVKQNLPVDAKIAAHDIGALGYYGGHDLVDLAGLISPDVIPFIRDERKLADYLNQQKVDFLITFPGWYPELIQRGELVYQTNAEYAPIAGGENMAIYRWNK